MGRRRHPCDVCGHDRKRWQRLCATCWTQLPGELRSRITGKYRLDKPGWRAAIKEAIALISDRVQRHMARTAAQTGERDA